MFLLVEDSPRLIGYSKGGTLLFAHPKKRNMQLHESECRDVGQRRIIPYCVYLLQGLRRKESDESS